jgi:hypothetical protein
MNLELLLSEIAAVNKKYDEIYRISGEKFNVFNILKLTSDEISHSRIIASLLNPNGSHGKGSVFLNFFLKIVGIDDFSVENVTVETEKFIGYISTDNDSGGRIDILITNGKKQQVIIENKIYADDQSNQLLRYNEYNHNAHLLYLTLYGSEASDTSVGKEIDFEYKTISYEKKIIEWLELCKKESIDNAILRETLTQYIILIKQLTGKARSKEMQKEYFDIIMKNAENVSAAFTISQNMNEIKQQMLKEKFIPLLSELAKSLNLELDLSLNGCFDAYWGFSFYRKEWKLFKIDFEFEHSNFRDLIYGFCCTKLSKEFDVYLRSLNYDHSKAWPLYRYMDKYRNWNKDFFVDILSLENDIVKTFQEKINEILMIVKNKEFEL